MTMFGFRGINAHRVVHSAAAKNTSSDTTATNKREKASNSKPQDRSTGRNRAAARWPAAAAADENTAPNHFFDDNSSVDMSLYTTRSKATVQYPPRLLNYGVYDADVEGEDDEDDDDSYDEISIAPIEFTTTKVTLKQRYSRLAGTRRPSSPLRVSPQLEQRNDREKPSQSTPSTAPCDDDDDDNDDDSETNDCEATTVTTYSLLPATAKMARFAFVDSTGRPQSTPRTTQEASPPRVRNDVNKKAETGTETHWVQNALSAEACGSTKSGSDDDFSTNSFTFLPKPRKVGASSGPVDLDEWIDSDSDSDSGASYFNSAVGSPCRLALAGQAHLPDARAKLDLNKSSMEKDSLPPHRGFVSPAQSPQRDDDTFGFSLAESSISYPLSSPTTQGSSRQTESQVVSPASSAKAQSWLHRPQERVASVSPATAQSRIVSSETANQWLHRPQESPGHSLRDDDTFGFSTHSSTHKSVGTKSRVSPALQDVRRVELFQQWEEYPYDKITSTSSLLSKSRAVTLPIHPRNEEASSSALNLSSTYPVDTLKTTAPKQTGTTTNLSKKQPWSSTYRRHVAWKQRLPAMSNQEQHNVEPNLKDDDSLDRLNTSSLSKSGGDRHSTRDKKSTFSPQAPTVESPTRLALQSCSGSPNLPCPPSQTNLSRQATTAIDIVALGSPSRAPVSQGRHHQLESVGKKGVSPITPVGNIGKSSQAPALAVDPDLCALTVMSALTAIMAEPLDDDTYGFSTASPAPIPPVGEAIFREEDEGDYVWTDNQGERDDESIEAITPKNVQREIVDRTYQETMDSISLARRSNDSQRVVDVDEDEIVKSPGSVLLTETELQKHLKKVDNVLPLPSSSIEGYDAWKQQTERQQRYFAALQAKASQRKRELDVIVDRRQPAQSPRSNPIQDRRQYTVQPKPHPIKYSFGERRMDSTRSAMDQSMDSSIPTVDDGKLIPRKYGFGLGWGWFQVGRKVENKNKEAKHKSSSKTAPSKHVKKEPKKWEPEILPLSQFMRISSSEPSIVVDFSLAPLNKEEDLTLAASTVADGTDSLAATKSHYLEDDSVGPRRLAVHFLEEERDKQRQAEFDRSLTEKAEQQRIARLRLAALERLRKKNLGNEKRLYEDRNVPLDQRTMAEESNEQGDKKAPDYKGKGPKISQPTTFRGDHTVIDTKICASSKPDASIKPTLCQILSPCIICKAAERSHIAVPCMHFSFCGKCVDRMYVLASPVCPVCCTADVVFTRVYIG